MAGLNVKVSLGGELKPRPKEPRGSGKGSVPQVVGGGGVVSQQMSWEWMTSGQDPARRRDWGGGDTEVSNG